MRSLVLAGFMFLGLVTCDSAESQDVKFSTRRIAGNVHVLDDGQNGLVPVLVGSEGLLVINGPFGHLQQFLSALTAVSEKPVRYVVETQCDAVNQASLPANATIVAHENVRKRYEAKKCDIDGEPPLPTLTFNSELTLHFADEEVRIIKLPTGHSDNDAVVYFRKANVLATGDIFSSDVLPGYTKYAGGNMLGVAEQLRRIVALVPEDAKIIPGHGPLASVNDLRRAIKILDDMKVVIAAQVAKGKTLEQLREMDLLAPWKDMVVGPRRPNYLKSFYDCLAGPPDPKFQL
jgi:glyoxylase-like metal-dependent hydrolase (beta-lactamase superfamily II)